MDDGGEVDEEGVTDGFDDMAVMCAHGLVEEVVMDVQQSHGARFVRAHLAAEADDVSEHNRGQPPSLQLHCLQSLTTSWTDYAAISELRNILPGKAPLHVPFSKVICPFTIM